MKMKMNRLPYVAFKDEADREATCDIIRNGNQAMLAQYKMALKVHEQHFPNKRYSRRRFRNSMLKLMREKQPLAVCGFSINPSSFQTLKSVEWKMLMAYSRLIEKLARKWHKKTSNFSLAEFYNEASMAMIDSIYGYIRDVKFITYASWVINRRLHVFVANNVCRHKKASSVQKLQAEYDRLVSKANGPVTFDEIVKAMRLNDKQIKLLSSSIVAVVTEADLNQYESESELLANMAVVNDVEKVELSSDEKVALEMACKTDWNRKVLNAFLEDGERGWQTNLANSNINPATGKNYTRAAPAVTMERLKESAQTNLRQIKARRVA